MLLHTASDRTSSDDSPRGFLIEVEVPDFYSIAQEFLTAICFSNPQQYLKWIKYVWIRQPNNNEAINHTLQNPEESPGRTYKRLNQRLGHAGTPPRPVPFDQAPRDLKGLTMPYGQYTMLRFGQCPEQPFPFNPTTH